jgi:hypothetical protein
MNLEGSSTPTPRVAAVTVEMSFQMKAGTIMSDSILTRYLHALEQILCRRGENRYFTLPTLKRRYFSTLKRGTVPNSIDHNKTDDAALLNSSLIGPYRGVEGRSRGNRLCHGNRYPRLR